MFVYSFFLVFLFNFNYIYISNFIYYGLFLVSIKKAKGNIRLIRNSSAKLFMFLFIIWVTITTFLYAIYSNRIDLRTILQYIFTLQYLILIISLDIDYERLKKWIFRFSILLAILIISVAIFEMIRLNQYSLSVLFNNNRAYQLFPGWPNSIPIPLLLSLFISLRNKKEKYLALLLILALILTTSRGAYLGTLIVVLYYFFSNVRKKRRFIIISLSLSVIILFFVGTWLASNPYMSQRLLRTGDRVDIYKSTMEYVKLNPIVGYGGNTIEQLSHIKINYKTKLIIPHTHNWVLEVLVRYGLVGLLLFSSLIVSLYKSISEKDCKFLFLLYVFLALFQTFMRDFVFIFILAILASNKFKISNKQSED